MALRLTGNTSPAPGAPAPASPSAAVAQLGLDAAARLRAGDVDGYRSLLDSAGELADPQRRYQALLALLEHGLMVANGSGDGLAARVYVAIADGALSALERSPAEPVLLNTAGIACYELWSLDAARDLFAAARRLNRSLPDVERNLSEVARRKRGPRPRRPLHAGAVGLARRAAAVARRAHPASGLTLSLCMIVRDEQERLGACLAAAAPVVDELVIVDTGSNDRTIEIARSFGARVIERPWTGSFSEARNASFDAATGDWLLFLDADEVLVDDDGPRLRELLGQTWHEAFYLIETSYTGELGDGTAVTHNALRLFRNRPEYRFDGRIHEQIEHTLPTWARGRVGFSPVRVEHYGYLGQVRQAKEKFSRNAELLRRQAAESGATAFIHHNLGSEYGATGDFPAAVREFETAWAMLQADGLVAISEYAPSTLLGLVKTLRATGRPTESTAQAQAGLVHYPDLTDLVYEQALTARAAGDDGSARELYERCMEMGDAPPRYGGLVGTGTYWPRSGLAMMALARGDAARARELLGWCIENRPGFLGAAGPYATACVRDGVRPEAVVAELEDRLQVTPRARLAIAVALQRAGAGPAALTQLRRLLDGGATGDVAAGANVALAELALAGGDLRGAARAAASVPDDDRRAALACRIETCAHLADGDPAAARTALDRGATVGLPAAEAQMFEAWIAASQGATAPPLAIASVPLLGALMEILLGCGAMDAFGALRDLLATSQLPPREQRQLLAEAQLRHGHLTGAALEWMEVCTQAPDVAALLGLAQVAAANGMPEDAVTFAGGALELDPGCDAARALLQGLRAGAPELVGAGAGAEGVDG